MSDPVERAIKNFEFHPSIFFIKNRIRKNVSRKLFRFNEVTKAEVLKKNNYNNNKKANPFNTIPLQSSADTLTSLINKSLIGSIKFPSNPNLANITPIFFKKGP